MGEIRTHPRIVLGVGFILLAICLVLVHPVSKGLTVAGGLFAFYLLLLLIPLGNCLEMGLFTIVLAVLVACLVGGVFPRGPRGSPGG